MAAAGAGAGAAAVAVAAAGAVPGAATGSLLKTFRTGTKQVFLPRFKIAMLRPQENEPPTFATFVVPLNFNKFDMRDYLLHLYNTPVLAVRSHIRQSKPRLTAKLTGRMIRPAPVKMMKVQLVQPFVWPAMPTSTEPWRTQHSVRLHNRETEAEEYQKYVKDTGRVPLRDTVKELDNRKTLKAEAQRLLKKGGWTNKRPIDIRFSEKSGAKR
ncbi:hypothetical protein F5X98DRAFT_371046 [Xylaria grammica]|nr:hypothetical protein F5X98DRAFT_371046 [Xylaria grammica]